VSEETATALCRRFGFSRKTGYKWLERYRSEGIEGLSVAGATRASPRADVVGCSYSGDPETPRPACGERERPVAKPREGEGRSQKVCRSRPAGKRFPGHCFVSPMMTV
jgi:transposase-like protein